MKFKFDQKHTDGQRNFCPGDVYDFDEPTAAALAALGVGQVVDSNVRAAKAGGYQAGCAPIPPAAPAKAPKKKDEGGDA